MVAKTNILFVFLLFSLFLFASSLQNKASFKLSDEDVEADKELRFGMAQDFDSESLVEFQLEDMFTEMSDKNSNFMDEPKPEAKAKVKAKKFLDQSD